MKSLRFGITLLTVTFLACSSLSYSQSEQDTSDIALLSLEEIVNNHSVGNPSIMDKKINSKVAVGAVKPLASRKSPSILSIVTSEEIQRSGSRDLIDILRLIPGINFNVDVQSVIGISTRGNWANEGKVLLLIDGLEMNETVYGTLQFGNHFPIDQIERIEVIRGPGSAIYGGAAEYAVINVISKTPTKRNEVTLNGVYGQTSKGFASNNYTVTLGHKTKDFEFSLINFIGMGNKSDGVYQDIYGTDWNMANNSMEFPLNINLGMAYKSLSFRFMYDNYRIDARDGFDYLSEKKETESFKNMIGELKYEWRLNKSLTITPKFTFKQNSPFEIKAIDGDESASDLVYTTIAERYKAGVTSVWEPSKHIRTTVGVEGFYDTGHKKGEDTFRNSETNEVNYSNAAVFVQNIFNNKVANVIIGARYDYNNSFGSAFVPRIGLTKRIENLNLKLLYSSAFKAPTIENVETSLIGNIKPEKTNVLEFEVGYQLNNDMFLTANIFDITSKNTIIYFVDTSASNTGVPDGYINAKASGTQGFELEYKFAKTWGYFNLNYSFYTIQNKPKVEVYAVPESDKQALGIGNHKLSASSSFNISNSIYISPTLVYNSEKSAIISIDENEEYVYTKLPATYNVHLVLGTTQFLTKGLTASAGVYNLLDEKMLFVQPYSSGHAPLPGMSREFLIKLNYNFQL